MRVLLLSVVCVAAFGCVEVPEVPLVTDPGADGGASSGDGGAPEFDAGPPPVDNTAPTLRITAPADATTLPSGTTMVSIEGTAQDDVGVAAVSVAIGPNAPVRAATTDFFRTWRVVALLPHAALG